MPVPRPRRRDDAAAEMICACPPPAAEGSQSNPPPRERASPGTAPLASTLPDRWALSFQSPTCRGRSAVTRLVGAHGGSGSMDPLGFGWPRLLTGQIRGARSLDWTASVGRPCHCSPALSVLSPTRGPGVTWPARQRGDVTGTRDGCRVGPRLFFFSLSLYCFPFFSPRQRTERFE